MNALDIAILGVLFLCAVAAFFRGFVQSVLWIAVWVGAAAATAQAFPYVSPLARQWVTNRAIADIAAGLAVFVASLIVLSIVRHAIGRTVRNSALSALDRSLGFLFGLAFGTVLISAVYFGLAAWSDRRDEWPDWAREARLLPAVERATLAMCSVAPKRLRDQCDRVVGPTARSSPGDIEREFERLAAPPAGPGTQDSRPGYKDQERRELDRLFESTR
jgi:membrane protein required for colicin V production